MTTNCLKNSVRCALLLAPLLLLSSCARLTYRVAERSGPASLGQRAVERTSEDYLHKSPVSQPELAGLLSSPPTGTHSNDDGDYSHWETVEQDTQGGVYIASAGCLSVGGRLEASYIHFPEPFSRRGKMVTYGTSVLMDAVSHPGMQEAMRKTRAWHEAQKAAKQAQPAAPAAQPAADKAQDKQAPAGQQPAPAATQQDNSGTILRTINSAMDIFQKFI